ncbi:MAG: glycoside hydrolase family 3 N-terminal domain-containing protein, partial [Oscillospiraceae bacterium]
MCQNNSEKIKCIIEKMTLKQKVEFLSGADDWHTKAFEDLGIPSIQMNDGPNGLRIEHNDNKNQSYPAVCYPAISTIASSWDKNQFAKLAKVLAQEAKSQDVDIVLGPGVNIKRSPLCGRNFEYMSEDPVLSSKLATEYIKVLQENGVSACIKHFACNNQEYRRMVT